MVLLLDIWRRQILYLLLLYYVTLDENELTRVRKTGKPEHVGFINVKESIAVHVFILKESIAVHVFILKESIAVHVFILKESIAVRGCVHF